MSSKFKSSSSTNPEFNSIEELIQDIRDGKIVILVDDEDRENEGDLVLAADHVTPALINFMAVEARGLVCLALSSPQIDRLQLPQMVREDMNLSPNKTAFTVSIEAAHGVSTGISAADRAHTVKVASSPLAGPADITMPGHIFPIRAQNGGVLKRAGHTEGSVDLAQLAGLNPGAVICEVMNDDGTMARVPDLIKFARKHHLKIGTIVDLIHYRLQNETLVKLAYEAPMPQTFGAGWSMKVYKSQLDQTEHLVLQKGILNPDKASLVRVHVDHFVRDFIANFHFGDSVLLESFQKIDKEDSGVIVLLRGFNRPQIISDLKALSLSEESEDSKRAFKMDERDYGVGAQILRDLGLRQVRLLTNHPDKKVALKAFDLEIIEVVSLK